MCLRNPAANPWPDAFGAPGRRAHMTNPKEQPISGDDEESAHWPKWHLSFSRDSGAPSIEPIPQNCQISIAMTLS